MPDKFFFRSCCAAAFAFNLLFSPAAFAGFEWVPQNDMGGAQTPPAANSYAPATAMPEIISPVIISGDTTTGSSMSSAPVIITGDTHPAPSLSSYSPATSTPITLSAASSAPSSGAPVTIPVTPPDAVTISTASVPTPAPAPVPTQRPDLATATISVPSSGGEVVQGFASQVPLPLALRQILPVGYNFSIDPSVDMDTLVSYKGGKSWRDTLHDMLAAAGLVDREQGDTITVMAAAPVVTSAAPAPSPVLSPLPEKSIGQLSIVSSAPASRPMDMSGSAAPAEGWSVERGDTLRKTLTAWCQRAGVELQWIAEYDYPVEASAHFNGSFEDAVRNLLAGFNGAQPQPIGELHTNPNAGQMVLVVQARGNNFSN